MKRIAKITGMILLYVSIWTGCYMFSFIVAQLLSMPVETLSFMVGLFATASLSLAIGLMLFISGLD
jgi:hypothetical protein